MRVGVYSGEVNAKYKPSGVLKMQVQINEIVKVKYRKEYEGKTTLNCVTVQGQYETLPLLKIDLYISSFRIENFTDSMSAIALAIAASASTA